MSGLETLLYLVYNKEQIIIVKRFEVAKRGLSIKKQLFLGGFILLAALLFSGILIFSKALAPYQEARTDAWQLAQEELGMTQLESFAIFNGDQTYYSLQGKDETGKSFLVLIPEAGGDILSYPADSGISAQEAEAGAKKAGAKSIHRTTFAYIDHEPVWEIYADQTYYYLSFKKGELIFKEEL